MLLFYVQSHQIYLCDSLQGAPGNRGFPGQDGLAGAKVGCVQNGILISGH